jgi:hypothetical protein
MSKMQWRENRKKKFNGKHIITVKFEILKAVNVMSAVSSNVMSTDL